MNTPIPDAPRPAPPLPAADPAPGFHGEWRPMPPDARKVGSIVAVLVTLPVVAGAAVLLSVLLRPEAGARAAIVVAAFFVFAAVAVVLARARWRRTQWRLDDRGLQVRRGLVWQSEILVPRSRVQHLDLERGPIERRYGLATLVVHTAGTRLSALRQGGFADADAVAVRDALLPEAGDDDL